MALIQCYVDDDLLRFMRVTAADMGRTVEDLAESAIENSAIAAGFRRAPVGINPTAAELYRFACKQLD